MNKLEQLISVNNDGFDIPTTAMYIAEYEIYPSFYSMSDSFDIDKIYDFIFKKYKVNPDKILADRVKDNQGIMRYQSVFLKLEEGLHLRINNLTGIVRKNGKNSKRHFLFDTDIEFDDLQPNNICNLDIEFMYNAEVSDFKKILKLETELNKFVIYPKKKGLINIVTASEQGFELKPFKVKVLPLDVELNYGKAFKETHNIIYNSLNSKEEAKGIVLLYGIPGTGKTVYIRHLINTIQDKKIIYLTPDLAGMISDPKFITFLLDYPDSILVIEDGENVLRSRKSGANQSVANLLNLADGLLSDALNMQIVCTFNCDLTDIDTALLRKGRLIAKHFFSKLKKEEAQKLSNTLGNKGTISEEMTLADIYNQDQKSFEEEKEAIGFKRN